MDFPKQQSNRKAIVLTADKFEDLELYVPAYRLLEAGWQVDVAAPTLDQMSGEHGYRLTPDITFESVDPSRYELLLIPGGFPDGAPATVRDHPKARAIVKAFFAQQKPVASICHGPWVLAAAGVVEGRRLTSYWEDGVPEDVRTAGGHWEDRDVVVDANLVTSRWPPDLAAFCREMMKLVGH